MLEIGLGKSYMSTVRDPQAYTDTGNTKEVTTMPNEKTATKAELKFGEQDNEHKLDMINLKIDTLAKAVDKMSTKTDSIANDTATMKTSLAVLSEKETTTRSLAWAIVVGVLSGLIKISSSRLVNNG